MITLSPSALQEVKRLMAQEGKTNQALRVGIKGGGCSGFTYQLALDEADPKPHDQRFEQDGVTILVDAKSHLYLDGTTIDYTSGLMGGGFEFLNPLDKKSCGCGHSFNV